MYVYAKPMKPMGKVVWVTLSAQIVTKEKHINQETRQMGGDAIPIYTRKEIQVLLCFKIQKYDPC